MSIGVLSTPRPGDVLNIIDLNSDKESEFVVRSVFDRASAFDLIDTSSGELVRRPFSNLGECELSAVPLAHVPAELSPWVAAAQEAVSGAHSAQHGARSVPLGKYTNNTSNCDKPTIKVAVQNDENGDLVLAKPKSRHWRIRGKRYRIQKTIQRILKRISGSDSVGAGQSPSGRQWRTCNCSLRRNRSVGNVEAKYDDEYAHYGNLQMCGSVHLCPVCAHKIMRQRAKQLETLCRLFKEQNPNGVILLLTFTCQHDLNDSLSDVYDTLKLCVKKSREGSFYRKFKELFNIDGYVRSTEFRFNRVNGHHPHMHELLFIRDTELSEEELTEAIDATLGEKYRGWMEKSGRLVNDHTFDVRTGEGIEKYLTKSCIQLEMTEGNNKKSRGKNRYPTYSPFQLISEYERTGDEWFVEMFAEYARATFRQKQMTFSRGFLARYGVDELEDEDIVNEREKVGRTVLSMDYSTWRKVCAYGLRARLLEIIEQFRGDTERVANWMIDQGLISSVEDVRPAVFVDFADDFMDDFEV